MESIPLQSVYISKIFAINKIDYIYMYAYMMHIIDYFIRYWDNDANERYNKYKREQILENNRKAHYKRKLEKLGITSYDYKSIKAYVKNEIQCNDSEIDEILEDSVHSGIDLNNHSRWFLLPVFYKKIKYILKN